MMGAPELDAVRLSLWVATLGAALGLVPAVGLGYLLSRARFRGKSVLSVVLFLPLVMPPVVTGLLLLRVFGRRGLLGGALQGVGIQVPFTLVGAVLAALTVGLPLYVIAARSAFDAVDRRYEEVARSLGLRAWRVFARVTLPLALPGLAAGAVLAFARALGEFGATAIVAGDVPGRTRTIALAVYALLGTPDGEEAAMRLGMASVAMSLLALGAHELLLRRHRRRLGDER